MKATGNEWDLQPTEYDEKETDRILSEGLLKLSFNERNKINEEIHGVRTFFPEGKETPESVHLALLDMDRELENILLEQPPSTSNEQSSGGTRRIEPRDIPTNRALRLAFLRCELFDAKKAAVRLLTYVRVLRDHSSCRDEGCMARNTNGRIRASKWFTTEEFATLKKGAFQFLPYRDQSGRRVLIALSACFHLKMLTRLKIILYLLSIASEDVETQKMGLVILIWPGTSKSIISTSPTRSEILSSMFDRRYALDFQKALPLRVVCVHFGFMKNPNPLLNFAKMMIVTQIQDRLRARFNLITCGTITELNYTIMGFGIHPTLLPLTDNGVIKTKNHILWVDGCIRLECEPYGSMKTAANGGVTLECPGVNDVLFHRGKFCQHHPGNVAFRGLLESRKKEHMAANQTMKKNLALKIMEEVERRGGRFLHWDKTGWCWVEFKNRTEIRHKVATSLRDFNKQSKGGMKRQNTHSSTTIFQSPESKKQKRDDSEDTGSNSDTCSECDCLVLPRVGSSTL